MKACKEVREEGRRTSRYDFEGHPVRVREASLEEYGGSTEPHSHEEMEFVLVREGHLLLEAESGVFPLEAGQGAFINAQCRHRFFSEDGTGCQFLCLQLHPVLLCTSRYVEERFVVPFLSGRFPCVPLSGEELWEKQVLQGIETLFARQGGEEVLENQLLLFEMWLNLYKNVFAGQEEPGGIVKERRLTLLKAMTDYIRQNYSQKIKLEDIAQAGGVQKTSCSNLFKFYLRESPISFLTSYRLRAGAKLLTTTNATVTDITYAVGFSSASYFVRAFRERYGCTPQQYRSAQARQEADRLRGEEEGKGGGCPPRDTGKGGWPQADAARSKEDGKE